MDLYNICITSPDYQEDKHKDRLNEEMKDIKEYNLAGYFLIVADIMKYCNESHILTGCGRGSAAGSLVSYLAGITGVDPLDYGLIWSRFFNSGRQSPAHISFKEKPFE